MPNANLKRKPSCGIVAQTTVLHEGAGEGPHRASADGDPQRHPQQPLHHKVLQMLRVHELHKRQGTPAGLSCKTASKD